MTGKTHPIKQAINAYHHITATPEFKEIERMRSKARHDEAQALYNARQEEREKWQTVITDKDAQIAELQAQLEKRST